MVCFLLALARAHFPVGQFWLEDARPHWLGILVFPRGAREKNGRWFRSVAEGVAVNSDQRELFKVTPDD